MILKHEVALNGFQTVNIGVKERSTIQYAIYICNIETITNLGTCLLSSGNKQNREKIANETTNAIHANLCSKFYGKIGLAVCILL